jgi:pimeloyl-ACP methyl ester carboxylesterase
MTSDLLPGLNVGHRLKDVEMTLHNSRRLRRALGSAALLVMLIGLLAGGTSATPTAAAADERRSYTGAIDGAQYRVEMPEHWNGTLVLYSHGGFPEEYPPQSIWLTNHPQTEAWLLDHGYALAGSNFNPPTGYHVERALHDQTALLDWFEHNIGRPARTIATGQSLGAMVSLLLSERRPERFAGVATVCGSFDMQGILNAALDITFVVKTLLAPGEDIDLVLMRDRMRSAQALQAAVERALATRQGRARLALAGALNNVQGWYFGHQPRPTETTEWIRQQAAWIANAYIFGFGSLRADLERQAGGNPSSNVGIDYRRQLARSTQTALVRRAYRDAGLDLRDDLRRLAAAPRIASDPAAVAYMQRFGAAGGATPVPSLTLHTTGDGGAVPDQERWLEERVRRNGDPGRLRQLFVERGAHCTNSAAEEIVAFRSLVERIDTGRWPRLSPHRLNAAAAALGAPYQSVFDFVTQEDVPMAPAFTSYRPPRPLRPMP